MFTHPTEKDRLAADRHLIDLLTVRLGTERTNDFELNTSSLVLLNAMVTRADEITKAWFDHTQPTNGGLLPQLNLEVAQRVVQPAVQCLSIAGEVVTRFSNRLLSAWSTPPSERTEIVRLLCTEAFRCLLQITNTATVLLTAGVNSKEISLKRMYLCLGLELVDIGVRICTPSPDHIHEIPRAKILLKLRADLRRQLAEIEMQLADADAQMAKKL